MATQHDWGITCPPKASGKVPLDLGRTGCAELMGGEYTAVQVATTIANMIAGKHVVRVSRGLYRLRGEV